MKKLILKSALIAVLLLQGGIAFAQYPISVEVKSMATSKAYLYEYVGVKTRMVDSVQVAAGGRFQFVLPPSAHPGMYRIVVGPNQYWDFVFNREGLQMKTHFQAILDSLDVGNSLENRLLKRYMGHYLDISRKSELLQQLLQVYDQNDTFYGQVVNEIRRVNSSDPGQVAREIITNYPETYTARFLKIETGPRIPTDVPREKELEYVLEHFFDEVDFTDTTMVYNPALLGKVRLLFFQIIPEAYPPVEVEEAMKKSLDRLMSLSAVNDVFFEHILDDVTEWAERSEFEEFFAYLTEFYLSGEACKDDERAAELEEILEAIKKTKIGIQAPEIVLPLDDGPVILSEIKSPYVLIVFWASWCPQCEKTLPQLKDIYAQYHEKGFEIVSISLDNDEEAYQQALRMGAYPWINYSELKGWNCSIAYDYGIRATPTMILLDRSRKIIAKPRNAGILEARLKELL